MASIRSPLAKRQVVRVGQVLRGCLWMVLCLAGPLSQAGRRCQTRRAFRPLAGGADQPSELVADFTQTRSLKVLAESPVATGKVWVAPGRFRWELGVNRRRPSYCANRTNWSSSTRGSNGLRNTCSAGCRPARRGTRSRCWTPACPGIEPPWNNAFAGCRRQKRTRLCN